MSDDLAKQLRAARESGDPWAAWHLALQAAERIEQLEASSEGWKEIADEYFDATCERNTRIEKLEAALREIAWIATPDHEEARHKATEIARKALEGKDD